MTGCYNKAMTVLKVLTTPDQTLRTKSRELSVAEINSEEVKTLISDIYETLRAGEYGVGMSAIQVGQPLAVTVVMIRPTPNRPELTNFNKVYLNPKIVETFGEKEPMWEGCCSVLDENANPVYAKVPRYTKIRVEYRDEAGKKHHNLADGFLAHVLQHEIDHNNGILFTDLVDVRNIISQEKYRKLNKIVTH